MAGAVSSSEQDALAGIVKQVHAKLRRDFKSGSSDVEAQWSTHLTDTHTLSAYSQAMAALAKGPWANKMDETNRIQWCVDRCHEYFKLDVLKNLLLKDLRRLHHGMPTVVPVEDLPASEEEVEGVLQECACRRLRLLDVGSCYNPFAAFPQFEVTAVDIAPADEAVHQCDFLTLVPSPDALIKTDHYDVIIFSLLLSYLPSPQQRLQCCLNAHTTLRLHGTLLIITPDKSHQNRHAALMKQWKENIEAIGFHRWRYEKKTHLHCMGFSKCRRTVGSVCEDGLAIPQDATRDEDMTVVAMDTVGDQETFHELPFRDEDSDNKY